MAAAASGKACVCWRTGAASEVIGEIAAPIVMSGGLAQEPPWPNGQGGGLLIPRLRVQVLQGVQVPCVYFLAEC